MRGGNRRRPGLFVLRGMAAGARLCGRESAFSSLTARRVRRVAMAGRGFAWLVLAGLGMAGAARAAGQTSTTDRLEKFAEEFWAWRAETQPFSTDDIPRIERPGGKRDWSRAAIEKERQQLAEFRE